MPYNLARKQTNLSHASPHPGRDTQINQSCQATDQLQNMPGKPKESNHQINTTEAEVHRSQGSYLSSLPSINIIPTTGNTYSQVTKSTLTQISNQEPTTATSENHSMEDAIATLTNFIRKEIQKLSISICKFLKEIALTDLSKENKKGKELLTISATRKHFGSEVAEALLGELHTETAIACTPNSPGPTATTVDVSNKNSSCPELEMRTKGSTDLKQIQTLKKRQTIARTSKKKKT